MPSTNAAPVDQHVAGFGNSLFDAAKACLDCADPSEKCRLTRRVAAAFLCADLALGDRQQPPLPITMPGRPAKPQLVPPRQLAQRSLVHPQGKAAFIHAIAHIELNAVDLAWDAVYRFRDMPDDYYRDFARTADDEARHFQLLQTRLNELGYQYGDFDAHNGLWEMAEKTANSCLARMALVPRVLEARGLDVTPGMIEKLRTLDDQATIAILEVILREEVAHVAAGSRWFVWCCEQQDLAPWPTFAKLVRENARGAVRGPFNLTARRAAGFADAEMAMLEQSLKS